MPHLLSASAIVSGVGPLRFSGRPLLQTDSSSACCKHTCLRAAAALPLLGLSDTVSSSTSNAPARPLSWLSVPAWAAAAAAPFSTAASSLASFVTMSTSSLRCSTYSRHTVPISVTLQIHAVQDVTPQSQMSLCAGPCTPCSSTRQCPGHRGRATCMSQPEDHACVTNRCTAQSMLRSAQTIGGLECAGLQSGTWSCIGTDQC